ncbi:MAG: phosphate ABC transporter substrate-binding protein [Candidatus Cloacimonetes bacterium 4572_65]|nr:MAG: phosphate ABC transporter substrate-binding protein [Candidatus Cloacimonetes bacterium 4572_65]
MKRVIIVLFIAIAMLSIVACKNDGKSEGGLTGKITMSGSTTVLPIAQACAEEFMNLNPNVDISVRGGGSSIGIKDIMNNSAQIGNASRDAKDKEIKKAADTGINLYQNIVANDGIAVIVNPVNQITNLTLQQIQDIYTGKLTNWNQLGGADMKIVVVSRDTSSGTYEIFFKKALHKNKVKQGAIMVASNNAAVTAVKDSPGAISYAGLGYLNSNVKTVTVDNIKATVPNIVAGTYPISRKLNMYTNGEPTGLTKAFMEFILSAEGQQLVEKQGFIKITN